MPILSLFTINTTKASLDELKQNRDVWTSGEPHCDIFRPAPQPSLKVDVTNLVHVHIPVLNTVRCGVGDVARLQVLQTVLYHIQRLLLHIERPQMDTVQPVRP